ncbi:MAG: TetR/AcrR family transcriptional regulator [Armatimonadetes bacterium]|nr:TetR/AcrR family transcriptional regulator [Anaerolineae bacterium]
MSVAREQFIHTMCALLELQGYAATGLNQIIKESGSPKGSLYHYFPGGKEELTAQAIQQVAQVVLKRIEDSMAAVDDSPAEAIRDFLRNVAYNVELSGYRAGGPITTVALETAATNERLRDACAAIYLSWQRAFAARLQAGGITPLRAERLAMLIISTLEGGILLCRVQRSRAPLEAAAEELYTLINF